MRQNLNTTPAVPVQAAQPVQSYDLASAYVTALAGSPDTVMDWRCLSDRDRGAPGQVRRGTLRECWDWLCGWNDRQYGIFACVAAMDGQGRKMENVSALRASYADLDSADAQQQYERALSAQPQPSFAVQSSPGRYHVYWVTTPHTDRQRFTMIQRRLAHLYNGDRAVTDATRVMRLPGFLWHKAEPTLVTCWALGGYHTPTTINALDAATAHVVVPDGGNGERKPLGDPSLAAPSLDWLQCALDLCDPSDLKYDDWVSLSAAIKQAGWTLTDEATLRSMWDALCARYPADNPAENAKVWKSITDTTVGWRTLVKRVPSLAPSIAFGGVPLSPVGVAVTPQSDEHVRQLAYDLPTGAETTGGPSHLDVVQHCRDWRLPVGRDTFADRLMVTGPMPSERNAQWPRPFVDRDYTLVRLAFNACGLKPATEALRDGVDFWGDMNAFNPVTDWLNTMRWDGTARLDNWLVRYLGVGAGDWPRIAGPKFLIGMVARAMKPGCQMDTALVLEGPQGINKSTALRTIAGDDRFGDQLPNMKDKEGLQYLRGLWLVEIKELAAIRKSEVEEIKQFIDARHDRYRNPFGKSVNDYPRATVFAATTNETVYLKDPTGDRRWWPVRCGEIDVASLAQDREQLFAEAVHRFRAGEQWWLTQHEEVVARKEQASRRKVSEWFNTIQEFCTGPDADTVTMRTLFMRLSLPLNELSSPKYTAPIAGDLAMLGYRQEREAGTGKRHYVRSV